MPQPSASTMNFFTEELEVAPSPVANKNAEKERLKAEKKAKAELKKREKEAKKLKKQQKKEQKASTKKSKKTPGQQTDGDESASNSSGMFSFMSGKSKKPRAEYEAEIEALKEQLAQKEGAFAQQQRELSLIKSWARGCPVR